MTVPNREGKAYKHKASDAIVLVVKSKRMSAGTARHTVVIIDAGASVDPSTRRARVEGSQQDIDEVPVTPWERNWEEV